MKNFTKFMIIASAIIAAAAAIGGILYFLYKKQLWPFKSDCEKYFAYDLEDDEDFCFDDCDCDCCDCECEDELPEIE